MERVFWRWASTSVVAHWPWWWNKHHITRFTARYPHWIVYFSNVSIQICYTLVPIPKSRLGYKSNHTKYTYDNIKGPLSTKVEENYIEHRNSVQWVDLFSRSPCHDWLGPVPQPQLDTDHPGVINAMMCNTIQCTVLVKVNSQPTMALIKMIIINAYTPPCPTYIYTWMAIRRETESKIERSWDSMFL